MKFPLEVLSLFLLVSGTLTQDLSLSDALGDDDDVAPTPGKPKVPIKPKVDDFGLSLEDALGPDPVPKPEKPAAPPPNPGGGDGLDLSDALGPDEQPKKPAEDKPKAGGGGGTFDDSDLFNVGQGDYKPEGGMTPGRSGSTGQDTRGTGGADQPQEAGSGPLAGIISAVGVALVGAASSYFAYQKKKLCFKIQGGEDPERGKEQQGQSDPQVYSNLLKTS
uniref:CD99 molecule n=1 Tax=Tetraodon nigroviridis TaxID=99883 RepID=H3DAH6_TETNG